MKKPNYITDNDWKLLQEKYRFLGRIVKKLDNNYPVQYLIGNVDFYGYPIIVKKGVLIPRFETETLIEKTLILLKKYHLEDKNVLEIGTGSGCISITLKKEMPSLNIKAIDKSSKALSIAKKNALFNNVQIDFKKEDIFKYCDDKKYSLIISNPPYIASNEAVDERIKYEPKMAIYANNNGLEFYDYIITNAKKFLEEKSILAFEIGYKQGSYLKKLAKENFKDSIVLIEKDLSNKDRYLFIINE